MTNVDRDKTTPKGLHEIFGMKKDWKVDVEYGTPPDLGVRLIFKRGSQRIETPSMTPEQAEHVGGLISKAAWDTLHQHAQHRDAPASNLPVAKLKKGI